MEKEFDLLLERFLMEYPLARGIMFHSMETDLCKTHGEETQELEKYKDIPMVSMDESYSTNFSFIVNGKGTIIIFFVRKLNFISVYVDGEMPNKALAQRMYDDYRVEFETIIEKLKLI